MLKEPQPYEEKDCLCFLKKRKLKESNEWE